MQINFIADESQLDARKTTCQPFTNAASHFFHLFIGSVETAFVIDYISAHYNNKHRKVMKET